MKTFIKIGVDLAKNYFQIHAIEREGAPPLIRKLSRAKFREFFSKIAATRVGMEACGSAHYWARELRAMGRGIAFGIPQPRWWGFVFGTRWIYRVAGDSRRGRMCWIVLSNVGTVWTTRALAMRRCTTFMRFWR